VSPPPLFIGGAWTGSVRSCGAGAPAVSFVQAGAQEGEMAQFVRQPSLVGFETAGGTAGEGGSVGVPLAGWPSSPGGAVAASSVPTGPAGSRCRRRWRHQAPRHRTCSTSQSTLSNHSARARPVRASANHGPAHGRPPRPEGAPSPRPGPSNCPGRPGEGPLPSGPGRRAASRRRRPGSARP